jgi:hypothetical protein
MKQRKRGGGAESEEDAGEAEERHLEYRHKAQSIINSKMLDELETEVFETGLYENQDITRGSRYSVMAAEIAYSELLQ